MPQHVRAPMCPLHGMQTLLYMRRQRVFGAIASDHIHGFTAAMEVRSKILSLLMLCMLAPAVTHGSDAATAGKDMCVQVVVSAHQCASACGQSQRQHVRQRFMHHRCSSADSSSSSRKALWKTQSVSSISFYTTIGMDMKNA